MVLDYSHFDKPFDFILADKYIREAYQKVCNENPDSNILINITSSTTQMTSALYLLAATETERCLTLIQVLTPEKAGNITKPVGIDYDIEYEWNNLLDNLIDDTDIENRCLNITPDNARYHLACESIKSHMMHYDYNAALAIAKYTRHLFDKRVLKLLEAGVIRSSLFFSEAKTLAAEAGYSFITVESSDANEIFEYILYMKIKKERKELTEFSRAISPLLTGLFTAYLENVHKVDIKKFCTYNSRQGYHVLRRDKILPKECLLEYDSSRYGFTGTFRDSPLSCSNILPMIKFYCVKSVNYQEELKRAVRLREFEENVRNEAAHQMIGLTEKLMKEIYGFSPEEILSDIQYIFSVTFKRYSKNINWESYDEFNQAIIDIL